MKITGVFLFPFGNKSLSSRKNSFNYIYEKRAKSLILMVKIGYNCSINQGVITMTTYGYARVSTAQQAKEGESLETQIKQIESYCSLKGFKLRKTNLLVEKGVSGGLEFAKRPLGSTLFSKLVKGDVLIFAKLDRAFRNTRNALNTLHDLKERGVSVHFIDLGGDVTSNGIGSVMFTILSAFATFERERIGARISEVKQAQITEGKFAGGRTKFGFKVEDKKLVPDEEEQKLVRRIRKLKRRGMSSRRVASFILAKEGVKLSHTKIANL